MITAAIPTSDWIITSSAGFNGILTPADDTVQKCLQKLDDIVSSQIPVTSSNFDGVILTSSENTVQKCMDRLSMTLNSFVAQNGYVNKADSVMSFNNATRTFTIQPTGSYFEFFSYGIKYKKTIPQSVVIPNTAGLWFIYFDSSGTLVTTQTFVETIITKAGYTATVYWDPISAVDVIMGEERHGYEMDSQTHLYLHSSIGTQFGSPLGFALSGIVANGSGNSDTHAEVAISGRSNVG